MTIISRRNVWGAIMFIGNWVSSGISPISKVKRIGRRLMVFGCLVPLFSFGQDAQSPKAAWTVYQEWPFPPEEARRRQEETAKVMGIPVEKSIDLGKGVTMEFMLIPAGRFIMGTPEPVEPDWDALAWGIRRGQIIVGLGSLLALMLLGRVIWRSRRRGTRPQMSLGPFILLILSLSVATIGVMEWRRGTKASQTASAEFEAATARFTWAFANEKPAHQVTITRPFYLGKYEVTQEQYEQVVGTNPSNFPGKRLPVEIVTWEDAQAFCRKVKEFTGDHVRLPTEAEWEYACRSGSHTQFSFGDVAKGLYDVAWFGFNSGNKRAGAKLQTHPVGTKKSNNFGIYDMHGNVSELCQDGLAPYNATSQSDPESNPKPDEPYVSRGGDWEVVDPVYLRCANRQKELPDRPSDMLGFRCAMTYYFECER